ncbi:NAD-P-binding protein [Cristinia sonorae]|uniref:NAD-P-binding protein n=1 Tax=Cristinia sonorae TaxID=1940300 RepID=A0A8K0UL17_9AGAR|nr:NAD-P-binding protein [Cristinia sonorae]
MVFVWLITGTSSGYGRELTLAALKRGDRVIATARPQSFEELVDIEEQGADILELDVTDTLDNLRAVAEEAVNLYGHVDVVVNNAGYAQVTCLEEATPEDTFNQFNTNVFGGLNVARAFLPHMRVRKSGTVLWIGCATSWKPSGYSGLYLASKAAVRTLSKSLHEEIEAFGLRSICIEPTSMRTSFMSPGHRIFGGTRSIVEEYRDGIETIAYSFDLLDGKQPGDPTKAAEATVDLVKSEGHVSGRDPPSMVCLGASDTIRDACDSTLQMLNGWDFDVSVY